jgi:hypothetical protein
VYAYQDIITKCCDKSICVGDFGFQYEWDWLFKNVDSNKHLINPGNHDYAPYFDYKWSTGDYRVIPYKNSCIFTVRGAWSIDRVYRTEGIDWFANEELNYKQGLECFDLYALVKPEVVISHDCPHQIRKYLFGIDEKSNTSNLLQAMFDQWKPKLWIFGHHHQSKKCKNGRTQFICLSELETLEI